jgi:hypothetical protein
VPHFRSEPGKVRTQTRNLFNPASQYCSTMLPSAFVAASVAGGMMAAPPTHTLCAQPPLHGGRQQRRPVNVSFWAAATFSEQPPAILLGMGTGPPAPGGTKGLHVPQMLLFSAGSNGSSCEWQATGATMSEPRTSGCAIAIGPSNILFAGGHNNSDAYVGTVDEYGYGPGAGVGVGTVTRERTLHLPVGRELLGCAWSAQAKVAIFSGGKPPHPPAPRGETTEIDLWHVDTGVWETKQLSVPRKKVEAVALGELVLMAGGEIGHHPPPPPSPAAAGVGGGRPPRVGGYSSSVDVLNTSSGVMSSASLSLARQYFGVAAAGARGIFVPSMHALPRRSPVNGPICSLLSQVAKLSLLADLPTTRQRR